ncbi:MAG: RidA family protein [Kiritimatiellae bacterium]|nr:RidA family protein [Kiritimatiellia bacterium]
MEIETVSTTSAPAALGPYSQALKAGGLVYCSGQIPVVPATGEIEGATAPEQAKRAISNLAAVLEAAGSSLSRVLKTTVFLKNMDDFAAVNAVYAEMFGGTRPARSCVEVSRLPKGVLFEIDCIAAAE